VASRKSDAVRALAPVRQPHPGPQAGHRRTDNVERQAGHRLLILDRDTKFTAQFKRILKDAGVRAAEIPYLAPNCNAHAERFVRSIKSECVNKMIFFGESSLSRAIREYGAHYGRERNHQGIANRLVEVADLPSVGDVRCRERLGGLLKYYHRAA
jgi:transposase InsO family protein